MIELRWAVNAAGDKVLQYRAVKLIPIMPYGAGGLPTGYRTPEWQDVPKVFVDFPPEEEP